MWALITHETSKTQWEKCKVTTPFMLATCWKCALAILGWKWKSHSVVSDSLWPHGLYSPWNSPDQNTGVGSCSLLQGIFRNQESNPALPNCRQILYQLSHQETWYVHIGLNKILKFISPVFFILGFPGKEPTCQCITKGLYFHKVLFLKINYSKGKTNPWKPNSSVFLSK